MDKSEDFQRPILTVDNVLFTLLGDELHVLLPRRTDEPFAGLPSLIGGYIHTQEDADTHGTAKRVLQSKIGVVPPYLEQLAMFSGRDRDPRGWSATMAYISMIKLPRLTAELKKDLVPVDMLPEKMGFDHKTIVFWAVQRLRNKASYSSLPLLMLPPKFTMLQLQQMYETMLGTSMKKSTFRHRISELQIVESTGEMSDPRETYTRPAELYRAVDRKLWLFNEVIDAGLT